MSVYEPDENELADEPEEKRTSTHLFSTDYPVSKRLWSREEEINLTRRAHAGDEQARNQMLEGNIRLVASIARRYHCRSMVFEDLVQEGILGLNEAITKFDPNRGYKFSTYACYWIRQAIVRAIEKEDRLIRLPAYGCDAERKLRNTEERLKAMLGRDPTIEESVKETGLSRRLIESLRTMELEPMSLDLMVGGDEDTQLSDLIASSDSVEPEDECLRSFDAQTILEVINRLPVREQMVIKKRFGIECDRTHCLREIAEELKMSREGVRHMQNRTLKRLARMLKTHVSFQDD